MKIEYACQNCGQSVKRDRSPATLRGQQPKFCSPRCRGEAAKKGCKCSAADCTEPHSSHGFCAVHAARFRRTGDPLAVRRPTPLQSRWKQIDKDGLGGCWLWTGFVHKHGYGALTTRLTSGGSKLAHRASYELHHGAIPDGLQIDHLCHVRHCVNPDHLEAVTPKVNTERGLHGEMRTRCKYGHELTPENTVYDEKRNCRRCRTCSARSQRANAKRNRIGNETYKASRRKPCSRCLGPKEAGPRKRLCDACERETGWNVAGRGEGA